MARKSWDILLDGQPYLFGPRGGLDVGSALLEPGQPRQMGVIEIPSAHLGFGQRVGRTPAQAEEVRNMEVQPGVLLVAGKLDYLATTMTDAFSAGTATYPDRAVASFIESGKLFLIFPRKIVQVASDLAITTVLTAPVDYPNAGDHTAYTSACRWRGKWIIGLESRPATAAFGDSSQRYGYKYAEYDIATGAWANKTAGGDVAVSHVASTSNTIFRMVNYGLHKPPELFIGDDPTVDFGSIAWLEAIQLHMGGYCTALNVYGQHLFVFKRDGTILAVDQAEMFTPVVIPPTQFASDYFGFNAAPYLQHILIPAGSRIIRFDPRTLSQADWTPAAVQGAFPADATIPFPAGPIYAVATRLSNEVWCVTRGAGGDTTLVSRGVAEERFAWTNNIMPYSSSTAPCAAGGAIYETANGPALVIPTREAASAGPLLAFQSDAFQNDAFQVGQGASVAGTRGGVAVHWLWGVGFATAPAVVTSALNSGRWRSSRVSPGGAAAGLSACPIQVRFWRDWPSGTLAAVQFAVDDGVAQAITVALGTGPVALLIPSSLQPRIGRSFQVRVWMAQHSLARTDFPVAIDYEFVPSRTDAISIRLLAAAEQYHHLGGMWARSSAEMVRDTLLALEGSIVSVGFPSGVSWTVLVRDVLAELAEQAVDQMAMPSWQVTLDCRRMA